MVLYQVTPLHGRIGLIIHAHFYSQHEMHLFHLNLARPVPDNRTMSLFLDFANPLTHPKHMYQYHPIPDLGSAP